MQSSEGFPSTGASVPVELGCITVPAYGCIHQPRSSSNIIIQESSWSLISPPAHPLPFQEIGTWGLNTTH